MLLPLIPPIKIALLIEQIMKLEWYCSVWLIPSEELSDFWVKDKIRPTGVYSGDPSLAETSKSKPGLFSVYHFLKNPPGQTGDAEVTWNKGKPLVLEQADPNLKPNSTT